MRPRPPVELVALLPLGFAGIALGIGQAWGVGDPRASGIVEESLGGPGIAFLLALILVLVPALLAGGVAGWAGRLRGAPARIVLRGVLVTAVGLWAGLIVYAVGDLSCDGSCLEPDHGAILAAAAAGALSLVAGTGVALVVDRLSTRKDRTADPVARPTGVV